MEIIQLPIHESEGVLKNSSLVKQFQMPNDAYVAALINDFLISYCFVIIAENQH